MYGACPGPFRLSDSLFLVRVNLKSNSYTLSSTHIKELTKLEKKQARGAHHFELQPLVCIVCSGKVITLTQQCITQVTKVTTNSQQDP